MKQNENNDKWLAEIKDKMLDFQAEAPANGWERVSSALPNSNGTRRLGYWSFGRWGHWGVAAAVLLCLVIGGYLMSKEEQSQIEDGCRAKISEPQSDTQQSSNYAIPTTADNITNQTMEQLNAAQKSSPYIQSSQTDTLMQLASADTIGVIREEQSADNTQMSLIAANESDTNAAQKSSPYPQSSLTLKTDVNHWSFGMNIGGHGSLLASNLGSDMISNSGVMDDSFHGTGSNANLNDMDDSIVESSNHTSWSIGISVDKEILPHTYIETGVVYTMLSSDVRYKYAGVQAQKVHYLGVPLRVNYMLFSSKPYQLYVGGGMMLEHSLYATRDGKRFDVEPWQLSSNVSLGGQYKISKNLSLYIEPGLSCYFNANKDIPTLRTESPLYFNIRGGVRWLPY